ncbi:phage tail assembly chaperone [Mitsuokella jalaludinii]|uniref:phage tail assembly chaperone n=1 Tax=Mitsuokella jalaludinii TaxID=187979 RepID=UPI00307A9D71
MSLLDKLLKADCNKLTEKETAELEIPRLSKLMGEPFVLKLKDVSSERLSEIAEDNTEYSKNGRVKSQDSYRIGLDTVLEGTVDPDFRDKDLMKKFGVITPYDLLNKLFNAGELALIANKVTELCGMSSQNDVDELVKN